MLQGDLSHHGVKEKYQPLYQKLVLNMVEHRGFEPLTSTMRTLRATKVYIIYPRYNLFPDGLDCNCGYILGFSSCSTSRLKLSSVMRKCILILKMDCVFIID